MSLNKPSFFEEDQKINCCKNQYSVLKVYDSVREYQPEVSYFFSTIPFRSINLKSRISFLRFRSGTSTRKSRIFFTIPFISVNSESRISKF